MAERLLRAAYEEAKHQCSVDAKSAEAGEAILRLATISLNFLVTKCKPIELVSRVPGKQYFSFKKGKIVGRPANKELFLPDANAIARLLKKWLAQRLDPTEFAKLTYTIALAPCLAMELFDRQNKKGPATFFECYIAHLFAKSLGVNPTKRVRLPVHGRNVLMTMDFLFDVGEKHRKVHLPVKMSTRERVVQAWAHQRLLDAAYGDGAYRGVIVLFSETKLDSRSLEVVEICVPDQWLAYQSLLAHMDRIYYFDVPVRYQALTDQFPDVIAIKQFGEFFIEREAVLHS
jgi:hypothetical protein